MNEAPREIDCVVVGTCCLDLLLGPIPLTEPIGRAATVRTDAVLAATGGLVCNVSIALAKLGMRAAAASRIGDDEWGRILRRRLDRAGVDVNHLVAEEQTATSTTVGLVDRDHHHSFAFSEGAAETLEASFLLDRLDLFQRSRFALVGYYHLLPHLEMDLDRVLPQIRATGCRVAIDTAGGGGSLHPLDQILPHVDIYLPNEVEGEKQTGRGDPEAMIDCYRDCGASGLVGIKRGAQGVVFSPSPGELFTLPALVPPSPILDTVGAGDALMAGLIAGICRGLDPCEALQIGTATAAFCITDRGATAGVRSWDETLAWVQSR